MKNALIACGLTVLLLVGWHLFHWGAVIAVVVFLVLWLILSIWNDPYGHLP